MTALRLVSAYPYYTAVTVLTLFAFGITLGVWAGVVPLSFSTFAWLVSLTFFLGIVTLAVWIGVVVDRVGR